MNSAPPNTARASMAGFAAIAMWALLALLTDMTGKVPPFQLAAMTFFIGTLVGLVWKSTRKTPGRPVRWAVLLFGGVALFAYHALYFAALKAAPAVEASLIAYLWPLFIVIGSTFLPGEKLRWFHVTGALLGFAGTLLIVTRGNGFSFRQEYLTGYLLAFAAAFVWAGYSLASRRLPDVPTQAVIGYCAITTILALIFHLFFETTIMPDGLTGWTSILALGLLPVGAAFYVWDHGMKHGNIQLVGTASYAAPLLSTIILIAFGRARLDFAIVAACILITGGALLAARDTLRRKKA